jgi:hypothetical protein
VAAVMGDDDAGQIFAPPLWLRWMNVVAAGAVAGIALLWAFNSDVTVGIEALAILFGVAFLVFGVRALASQVRVTPEVVHYRGVWRSHDVLRSTIIGLGLSESWLSIIFGDIPTLVYREGQVARTLDLVGLAAMPGKAGAGQVSSVVEDLRATLGPNIEENL